MGRQSMFVNIPRAAAMVSGCPWLSAMIPIMVVPFEQLEAVWLPARRVELRMMKITHNVALNFHLIFIPLNQLFGAIF
jgi:hypothetical protein